MALPAQRSLRPQWGGGGAGGRGSGANLEGGADSDGGISEAVTHAGKAAWQECVCVM